MTGKHVETKTKVFQKPKRTFEKSGTVVPKYSYYVPLDNVVNMDNQDIKTMVDNCRYFSMFAPRQSGKTTFLEEVRHQLHRDLTYVIAILSFQEYSNVDALHFYESVEKELYEQLLSRLEEVACEKTETVRNFLKDHRLTGNLSFRELFEELNRIIQFKKIVILIDEFDGIPLDQLEGFLTSLRQLYLKYKKIEQKALYSVGLIGIRNITKLVVGGVSPFNIADQVDLPPFSLENVRDLYAQYTIETTQPFTEDAIKRVHMESGGQTWLVNRLATILTVNVKPETVEPIDENDVETAIQLLLKEKNVHFDNLYEKAKLYKETFVEIVFDHVEYNPDDEDQSWLEQYGLIKNKDGHAAVFNSIYKARYLKAFFREARVPEDISSADYILPDDRLDIENIIMDFEQYIASIGAQAFYKGGKPYEKTGQFLLTAWLYQFVRSGAGELRHEVVSGHGRMDILLAFKGRKYIIETKVNRRKLDRTLNDGINQVSKKYLASEAADEGYLVVFDAKTPVGEDCEPQYHETNGKKITSFTIAIGKTDQE